MDSIFENGRHGNVRQDDAHQDDDFVDSARPRRYFGRRDRRGFEKQSVSPLASAASLFPPRALVAAAASDARDAFRGRARAESPNRREEGRAPARPRRLPVDTLKEMTLFPPELVTVSKIKNKSARSDVFYGADLGPRLREPWRDPGFHS